MTLNKDLHIAISGKSGCGNTTVSGLLAEKLGIKL
ncbi:MAG: cytidylate kinase, partial [Treponema sp.]|nr:cytidylate kinase [Treponema sp.]MDD7269965.1 cytidylate kinase [Treponema sp.]